MNREQKAEFVSSMNTRLQDARALFLADFRGMSVSQDADLRAQLRNVGVDMRVVKNTLFLRALKDTPFDGKLDEYMVGPNAVMFADDVVAAAKALTNYLKENEGVVTLQVKGGVMGETVISADDIKELASMPSREELIGKFMAMLQSPLRDFTVMLQSPLRDIASVLTALEKKKSEEQ